MLRILAAAALVSAALVAVATPADAASGQATAIENFASSAATVTYQQPVTFTGELVARADQTPIPNEPVQINFQAPDSPFVAVATGTTDSDGQFTISVTLPTGGWANATFAGDTALGLLPGGSGSSFGIYLAAVQLPSRLVLDPAPAAVPAGTQVVFSGTLQVEVDGSWEPFQGAPLELIAEPNTPTETEGTFATTTDADGEFSLTEPVTATSDWTVETLQDGSYWDGWIQDFAAASYNWIDGVSRTQILSFHVPPRAQAQTAAHQGLYATGTVERWDGSAWLGLSYGFVDFYYRHKGSTTWQLKDSTQTDAFGQFKGHVPILLGTGTWQARVQSAPDTLTSTSIGVTSTITDRTHFVDVQILRRSAGSSTYGWVSDLSQEESFSSLRGLTLRLYYRAVGSKTWHLLKRAKVGAGGYFTINAAKGFGYRFKVVLPAQGPYLSCSSRIL